MPTLLQLTKEVTSIAPFLIPFLKMCCVYFVLWLPSNEPTVTAAFVKILPILSLIWFVCLQGVSWQAHHTYNRRILIGLVCSIAGDIFLVWQQEFMVFLAGMLCFGFAQLAYISAFGFSPLGLKELIVCLSIAFPLIIILVSKMSSLLLYPVLGYGTVLFLMKWRALARCSIKYEIPWRRIFAAFGAILFAFSDCCIGINKFVLPLPGERILIMATYYAAQLCLSLSVVNSRLTMECSHCTKNK